MTIWAILRLAMGTLFLWAFLDKLFGFGFATKAQDAWLNGGSPTTGFLKFGTSGPLASSFQVMAGSPLVDWLFMLALLGLGISLIFGIFLKIAGWGGAVLMLLIWLSLLPVEHHPFLDEHTVYALILLGFGTTNIGREFSLASRWRNSLLVQRFQFLA